jgi:NADH-quinone oxidoreductase subunit A
MFAQSMPVLLVLAVASAFAGLFLGLSYWLGPRRPSALKDSTYECGVPVRGTTQIRFFVRFFLVAIFFLLFELVAAGHGAFALGEMGVFVAVLVVGFVYIWRKGGLEWQ